MRTRNGWRLGLAAVACVAACGGTVSREPGSSADGGANGMGATSNLGGSPLGNEGGDSYVPLPSGGSTPSGKAGSNQGGRTQIGGAAGQPVGASGGPVAGAGGGGVGCVGNQVRINGSCACPPYASTFCAASAQCVNTSKNPEACGDCSVKCAATSACATGMCTAEPTPVWATTGCGQLELQMGSGALYVLATQTGHLTSIPLPTGSTTLLVSGLSGGSAFALDATRAYVATGTSVTSVNLTTGVTAVLVTEANKIFDVAVDQGKIYYASGKTIKQADAAAPSTGTVVATSADEGTAQGVAVSGGMVLYVSNDSFNVESDPIVGDAHLKIAASQAGLIFGHRSVQADASNVYWANNGVLRSLFTGLDHSQSTVAVPINSDQVIAYAIDPSAQTAYIATIDGSLEKSTFDSQDEATAMARALPTVTSVVLDDTNVYAASACKILKWPR